MENTVPSYVVVTYKAIDKLDTRTHYNSPRIEIHDGHLYLRNNHGEQTVYSSFEWVSVEQFQENKGQ